ncbi:MAG: hypothetical protein ACRD1N_05750, partial [Terriglobia bacterium]
MVQRHRHPGSSQRSSRITSRQLARFLRKWKLPLIACFCALVLIAAAIFAHYYIRFSRMVDARLSGQVFRRASLILSAPTTVLPGEPETPQEMVDRLRKALYVSGGPSSTGIGTFELDGDQLRIYPGPASFFASDAEREGPAEIDFAKGHIDSITGLDP